MKLRGYKPEDEEEICSWISDEEELYRWSADQIGKYPIPKGALTASYEESTKDGMFYPLCALDEQENLIGHLFIRYPDYNDKATVRFGFVIINPSYRGKGYGKEMLGYALTFAKERLNAGTVTLGVFLNNPNARSCYEAVGFENVGSVEVYATPYGDWECEEMKMESCCWKFS